MACRRHRHSAARTYPFPVLPLQPRRFRSGDVVADAHARRVSRAGDGPFPGSGLGQAANHADERAGRQRLRATRPHQEGAVHERRRELTCSRRVVVLVQQIGKDIQVGGTRERAGGSLRHGGLHELEQTCQAVFTPPVDEGRAREGRAIDIGAVMTGRAALVVNSAAALGLRGREHAVQYRLRRSLRLCEPAPDGFSGAGLARWSVSKSGPLRDVRSDHQQQHACEEAGDSAPPPCKPLSHDAFTTHMGLRAGSVRRR